MNRRGQIDDYGQVDGDRSGAVQFERNSVGIPWMRGGTPPWHMWGNSQSVVLTSSGVLTAPTPAISQQLVKVSYKRPDTWNWLFAAKFIAGEELAALENSGVLVIFDLTVGIGRSFIQIPNFETLTFQWGALVGTTSPPIGVQLYTTRAVGSSRAFPAVAPFPDIEQVVAQDLQVNARLQYLDGTTVRRCTVEVSGFVAPQTHVRPDWYMDAPPEVSFGGEEIGGR